MELLDLDQHALERHGLVVKATSGMAHARWCRMIERRDLELLHPGVARLVGTPRTYTQRIAAAVRSFGGNALASHRSAMHLHGSRRRGGTSGALDDRTIDAKPADSVLEAAFARLVARFDLPPYEFHPMIEGWEVDFRIVGTNLLVECDGWATHGLGRNSDATVNATTT